ncbi:hypothetical protein LCGC14_2038850 [marine sediment metagenome]|uniref:Uncharacterized protein n=1 Tax=marine sediment metagenome TaxID=412755 RepID=A0A0F9ESC0_9ZZZZ
MTEKEKQVQGALGTMERQKFVIADWKDIEGLIEGFTEALENFGLFIYEHPEAEDTDTYGFIVSNEQLTEEQINKLCEVDETNDGDFGSAECNGCEFKDKNVCSWTKGCAKSRKTLGI